MAMTLRVLDTARIGKKGMLYLPLPVREQLEIEEGDHIVFRIDDHAVRVEKLR